ncbi:hypothetical protein Q9189_004970 [Teloschistes chrysophthalmus]
MADGSTTTREAPKEQPRLSLPVAKGTSPIDSDTTSVDQAIAWLVNHQAEPGIPPERCVNPEYVVDLDVFSFTPESEYLGTPLSYAPALGTPLTLSDPTHSRRRESTCRPHRNRHYRGMTPVKVLQLYDELSGTQITGDTSRAEEELKLLGPGQVRPEDEVLVGHLRLEHELRILTLERWWPTRLAALLRRRVITQQC